MLKDLKKAVNSFVYSPSESKLANCRLQVTELVQFLQSIEVPKEEAKKPKASKSSKKSKSKTIRRPKRTSANGLELTQAKDGIGIGKAKKTKPVALDGSQAMPFEPRKEVPVVEPKVRRKEQMKLTLLEGETPQEAMARHRSAQIEAERLEALALIADTAPF